MVRYVKLQSGLLYVSLLYLVPTLALELTSRVTGENEINHTFNNGTVRICIPILPPRYCPADYEIHVCVRDWEEDMCVPCTDGLRNRDNSTSDFIVPCYDLSCPENMVYTYNRQEMDECYTSCICDETSGFVPDPDTPCSCKAVTFPCGPNTYLHNGMCSACAPGLEKAGLGYGPCLPPTTTTVVTSTQSTAGNLNNNASSTTQFPTFKQNETSTSDNRSPAVTTDEDIVTPKPNGQESNTLHAVAVTILAVLVFVIILVLRGHINNRHERIQGEIHPTHTTEESQSKTSLLRSPSSSDYSQERSSSAVSTCSVCSNKQQALYAQKDIFDSAITINSTITEETPETPLLGSKADYRVNEIWCSEQHRVDIVSEKPLLSADVENDVNESRCSEEKCLNINLGSEKPLHGTEVENGANEIKRLDQPCLNIGLLYPEGAEEKAQDIKSEMETLRLNNDVGVRVLDQSDPEFGGCWVETPSKLASICHLVLVVLVNDLEFDTSICRFLKNELIATEHIDVRPLHTQPIGLRSYNIPPGLKCVTGVNWLENRHRKEFLGLLESHYSNHYEHIVNRY